MSDLRFLEELGAEFERVGETRASAQPSERGRTRWARLPRAAIAGVGLCLSALIVVAVVAVGVGVHAPSRANSPVPAGHDVRIEFRATALNPRSPLGPSIERSVDILRRRLSAVFHRVQVSRTRDGLVVVVQASPSDQARIVALAVPARLEFYDWEANALTANGKTVAGQLPSQDPTAVEISQGAGSGAPGEPGAGSMSLYAAVQLAAKQPATRTTPALARRGREYYLFGAPGSAACATVAKDQQTAPAPGAHCMLLSAPVDETTTNPQLIAQDVASSLLPGIRASQGRELVVPQGTVVLLAAPPNAGAQTSFSSPTAQFYVLRDHVALFGQDITKPRQSTDQSGDPDVEFGFDSTGARSFQSVTAAIAKRGARVSGVGNTDNQHFAVALDHKLITVPSIDYKSYPDGIQGAGGADIIGGFTVQSARDLAIALRFGPLPVSLVAR